MLASLNSFLPSVLHSSHEHKTVRGDQIEESDQDVVDDVDGDVDPDTTMTVNDSGSKKREKKDKSPSETFIIVRPPPAKSNHPLNLQVQLVPPHSKPPTGTTGSINSRQSYDFPPTPQSTTFTEPNTPAHGEQVAAGLARVTSNRSESSAFSSVASFSSTASSTTGRRMIIPLYNLQAHNVMTNIIVDAGTDAKIAKLQKRGMELLGLAVLEPVEVWGSGIPSGNLDDSRATSLSSTDRDRGLLQPGQTSRSRPVTPDTHTPGSSALSLSSAGADPKRERPMSQITETTTSKRNIFGKLFKKKDTSAQPSPSRTPPIPALSSSPRNSKRLSMISNYSASGVSSGPTPVVTDTDAAAPSSILRPPILGIQPTSSSPRYPPVGRPSMYVWVVRKWLKGHDSSIISGMIGKIGAQMPGIGQVHNPTGLVEVRFEWKRGKTSAKRDKKKQMKGRTGTMSDSRRGSTVIDSSNTSLDHNGGITQLDTQLSAHKDRQKVNRLSLISHQSISTNHTSEEDRERERARGGEDTGEESDPEDTETPWTCTLRVRRVVPTTRMTMAASAGGNGQGEADQVIRTKLATLSPTPHHPKVVAMLKVPFPLPDIEVDNLLIRKRILGPNGGILRTTDDSGLVLTAEEIKDVVSSTGMWLVVREGFGGVGKVSRKGDGWRIRA